MKLRTILVPLLLAMNTNAIADVKKGDECFKAENFKCAFAEFHESAKKGEKYAQYMIGHLYMNGDGVHKDNAKAKEWMVKSALQGFVEAQMTLYAWYRDSKVHKNDKLETLGWALKAAEQGNADAQYIMGATYVIGEELIQDLDIGLNWLKKAAIQGNGKAKTFIEMMAKQGSEQAKLFLAELHDKEQEKRQILSNTTVNCIDSSTTELFGVKLNCAKRDEMRKAVKSAGAKVYNEDKQYPVDLYSTENVLEGSSILYMNYSPDEKFISALYSFPSSNDVKNVTRVRDLVAQKYGQPDISDGVEKVGNVTYAWILEDGITIFVSRTWPKMSADLSYIHVKNKQSMDELENQEKAEKYKEQSNAF